MPPRRSKTFPRWRRRYEAVNLGEIGQEEGLLGAYATDKAQSLYLGRPPGIHISDGNVLREFFDSYEELEE